MYRMSALIRGIYISLKNYSVLSNLLFRYTQIQTQRNLVIVCKKNTAPNRYFDLNLYYIQTCLCIDQANTGGKNVTFKH